MEDQSTILKSKTGYFHSQRPEMKKYVPENAIRILDVGCSDGSFCASLRQADREIWGVEMNKDAAKKASEICNYVLVGDFNEIYDQLPKNHFDCVVFNDVLEHLISPWDTIRLVKSLLSENGVIVSSIPNFRYIANLITEVVWEGEFRYKPEGGILDDTHLRFFTSKSIIRMFHEQGFEILTHEGLKSCKSWKEKLFINMTFGLLKDSRYKQFATVAKPLAQI